MDIKRIKEELESAATYADEAKDGDKDALKEFFRAVANARATVDSAKVRSDDQKALRDIVHIAADALERSLG